MRGKVGEKERTLGKIRERCELKTSDILLDLSLGAKWNQNWNMKTEGKHANEIYVAFLLPSKAIEKKSNK